MKIDGKKIITLPNIVTFFRLFLAFYAFYLVIYFDQNIIVLYVFIAFTVLDGVDGLLARLLNQRTMFGVYFDALVDSFFVTFLYLIFYYIGIIPFFVLLLLLFPRISTMFIYGIFRIRKFGPSVYRKIAAFIMYISIPFIYFDYYKDYFVYLTIIVGIITLFLEQILISLYDRKKKKN